MGNALYVQLTRQSGLLREMDLIAGNLANANTTGYRREGAVFSEYVQKTDDALGSLSMTAARTRFAEETQGPITQTNSQLDVAIEGDGFFQVQTQDGPRLTRSGAFTLSPENQLVSYEGFAVLDAGGAPIQLPVGFSRLTIAPDGIVSADGVVAGAIGLVAPEDPLALRRDGRSLYSAEGPLQPALNSKIAQGFLEGSNVDAMTEITRMIEVQRAYELGQNLVDRNDELTRSVVQTLGEPAR